MRRHIRNARLSTLSAMAEEEQAPAEPALQRSQAARVRA